MKYHNSFIFSLAFIGLVTVPIFALAQTTQPIQNGPQALTSGETISFTSNLYLGLRNSDILILQQLFQRLGYFPTAVQPTGYFGPVTKSAVQSFQAAHDIPTTGYAGILTRSALARVAIPGTPAPSPTPPPTGNKFSIGDRVQTTATLNVRATPYIRGLSLGTQQTLSLGTIVGGPVLGGNGVGEVRDGYTWWNINYDNAPDGWSVENFLAKALPVPPPLPPPQTQIPLSFSYHISDKLDKAGGPFTEQNNHPLLDSLVVNVKWALAEPKRGTYDWSLLDKKIAQWTGTSNKKVILKIAPYGADPAEGEEGDSDDNDTTPSWVYDTGVPRISFVGSHARQVSLPKVWDPNFYPLYEEFTKALGERYNNDPRVAGFMVGIGHNGNVNAQSSKGGGLAFVAAGWTLPTWEKHISEVIRISQKHLSKPLTMGSASVFLDKYRLEDNPDVAKRVFGDAAMKGISLIFGGMHPNLDNFNKSFNPTIVRHLATLNLPAGFTIGFHDDWPLWVPPHRSEKCPSPTCGRNTAGFDKEFQYVFDLWNSINRKYPIFFRFLSPESKATNQNATPCTEGGDLKDCFYKPAYDVAVKWLSITPPPPLPPSPPPPPTPVSFSRGVYSLTASGAIPSPAVWTNQNVSGVVIRTSWSDIEINEGQYNWGYIDNQITAAKTNSKKLAIHIRAGSTKNGGLPNWLLTQYPNAQRFSYYDGTQKIIFAAPWDPIYLQKLKNFINAFGSRYKNESVIAYLRLGGGQSVLSGWESSADLYDAGGTTKLSWSAAGFTSDRLVASASQTIDAFMMALPAMVLWDEPETINAWQNIPGATEKTSVSEKITAYGLSKYPNYGVWREDLHACTDVNPSGTTGYQKLFKILWDHPGKNGVQMVWNVQDGTDGNLSTFRMNPKGNCVLDEEKDGDLDRADVLRKAVDVALAYQVPYVEIYQADITDLRVASVIAYAKGKFLGVPPPPPPLPGNKFIIGDRVQTTATLNVRATPSVSGVLLGAQPQGALGIVSGGPILANGYTWWNINFDNAPDGWSVENYLTKYAAPTCKPASFISGVVAPQAVAPGGSYSISCNYGAVTNAINVLTGSGRCAFQNFIGTTARFSCLAGSVTGVFNNSCTLSQISPDNYCARADAVASLTVNASSTDIAPPSVSLTSPINGSTVSGTVTVSATASDNVGVTGVQFKLDGVSIGLEDTTPPYSIFWNTLGAVNGSHTLSVVARDAAGNRGVAPSVTVTVNNAGLPPPPLPPPGPPAGVTIKPLTSQIEAISWTTPVPSFASVEYKTAPFVSQNKEGSLFPSGSLSSTGYTRVLSTRQDLCPTDLTANTLYYARLWTKDAQGKETVSAPFTFRTNSPPQQFPESYFTAKDWMGLYATDQWMGNKGIKESMMAATYVRGVSISDPWSDVETNAGVYDWAQLDKAIADAKNGGKYIKLALRGAGKVTGKRVPDWVKEGVETIPFDDTDEKAIKWDPVYACRWWQFVTTFGRRYDNQVKDKFAYVGISGAGSGEMATLKKVFDAYRGLGYSDQEIESNMLWVWKNLAQVFAEAFPHGRLSIVPGKNPVSDTKDLGVTIVKNAADTYGKRLVIGHSGFSLDKPGFIIEQQRLYRDTRGLWIGGLTEHPTKNEDPVVVLREHFDKYVFPEKYAYATIHSDGLGINPNRWGDIQALKDLLNSVEARFAALRK